MLLAFWLASLAPAYCAPPQSATLTVVCPYLEALRALDHDAMARSWSPDARSVNAAGEERPVDPEAMRQMRGFERSVHTQWAFEVASAEGDSVVVNLTETNDFYDLLGLGPRHQTERYTVRDGRIVSMKTLQLRHENGDFALTFAAFRDWLMHTDAAHDRALVRDGRLLFTAESGRRMLPWLERWHEGHEVAVSRPVPPERADFFWSVAAVGETEGDRRLYGADFRHVIYWEDGTPPVTAYWGGQFLTGDGQSILRGSGTLSLFAFPAGKHFSFWFRPMAGVEYRWSEPDSGFGVLVALGGEVIVRPTPRLQVAVTVDRIFSTLRTDNQIGLAVRWPT